jgi:hypothetical protein
MTRRSFKLTVCFERRPDGGLRAYSDDVPGLVLSHADAGAVLDDVTTAIEVILSHRLNSGIDVHPLSELRDALSGGGSVAHQNFVSGPREYVAVCH